MSSIVLGVALMASSLLFGARSGLPGVFCSGSVWVSFPQGIADPKRGHSTLHRCPSSRSSSAAGRRMSANSHGDAQSIGQAGR